MTTRNPATMQQVQSGWEEIGRIEQGLMVASRLEGRSREMLESYWLARLQRLVEFERAIARESLPVSFYREEIEVKR